MTQNTQRVATTRPENRRGMTRSQIRAERRARSRSKKQRRRRIIITGGAFIALILIAALLVGPGLTPSRSGSDGQPLGLNTGGHIPIDVDEGQEEIEPGASHLPYSVIPATSGAHWFTLPQPGADSPVPSGSPARWGVYEEFLPDEVLIQNLEYGGVGFHYDCPDGCAEDIQALLDLIPTNPSQYIMSPYPGMPSKFAITAWRHHLYLDEVDEVAILEFVEEYKDRAPESVAVNSF